MWESEFAAFLSHWLEIKKAALPVGQSRRDDFRMKLRPMIGTVLRLGKKRLALPVQICFPVSNFPPSLSFLSLFYFAKFFIYFLSFLLSKWQFAMPQCYPIETMHCYPIVILMK
jgi:hypothetical protein